MKQLPEDIEKIIKEKYPNTFTSAKGVRLDDEYYMAKRAAAEFGYHLGVEQQAEINKAMHDKLQAKINENISQAATIERLKALIKQRERSYHQSFYSHATTMTDSQIEKQFQERWQQFATENNLL